MRKYTTDSDIGSVLIGNDSFTYAVGNGYGDGKTIVYVFDSRDELRDAKKHSKWLDDLHFQASAQGTFGIFEYDCDYHDLLAGRKHIIDAVTILKGRYGIYSGGGKVVFEKWEN